MARVCLESLARGRLCGRSEVSTSLLTRDPGFLPSQGHWGRGAGRERRTQSALVRCRLCTVGGVAARPRWPCFSLLVIAGELGVPGFPQREAVVCPWRPVPGVRGDIVSLRV